jgi:hypothetical protein
MIIQLVNTLGVKRPFTIFIDSGTLGTFANANYLVNLGMFFVFSVKQNSFRSLFKYLEHGLQLWGVDSIANQHMNAIVWKTKQT